MKKTAGIILSLLLVISIFSGCSAAKSNESDQLAVIEALSPIGKTVEIHTFSQKAFLDGSEESTGIYARGTKEKSLPKPVEFEWEYNGANDTQYTLCISESENMSGSVSYISQTESYSVYNLKIGTQYYWTVSAGGISSEVCSFSTSAEATRNLYIDGVTNARDLGDRKTQSGGETKQGMIFRCGRLNESDVPEPNIEITEAGKKTMLEDLGVKTEIDMRLSYNNENGGITESQPGGSVDYINCPMEWDGDMLADNKEQILKVFSVLADENNYPLFIHCNIGTDRTGMLSFMINALLGVPEEELFKDYLFSNFGNIGGKRPLDNLLNSDYYSAITQSEGSTLSEKTYNCLISAGVPASDLDSLIIIMTA